MNPYKDLEESSFAAAPHLNYEDIATKLLKDHFFLTALELHTELVESGKELPQLREFFSNPGNFEQHVSRASEMSSMHRTPSIATLDSLDTARYSEDGGGDRLGSGGDIAVLEFELRKAKETINSLRANLTQFADGESTLDKNVKNNFNQKSLKPHEKRALNFLINEYLLLQDYKLTSITFSDENPEQEFEDWDDVGLNMPRPSGLISLFRGSTTAVNVPKYDVATQYDSDYWSDAECQTDLDENVCVSCQTTIDNDSDWNHEILIQAEEINLLKQKIIALETEKLNFQKLYDAAIVSLNSLTSPVSEKQVLELQIPSDKLNAVQTRLEHQLEKPITCTAAENHYGSSNSTHSATPDQFEMIESEKHITKKEGSNTSSIEPALLDGSVRDSPLRRGSVTTLDDMLSINDAGEWTRLQYEYNIVENSKEMWIDSGLPNNLKESLLTWCNETLDMNEALSNDLLTELVNNDKPILLPALLQLVADTLPRILPHTLVGRRSESAALLSAAIVLLPPADAKRAKLLQTLLTLFKKPDPPDAKIICEATCLIVKWGGSGEVLSSIAELLASRSPERRILASQICLAIAPYVPIELCTSLLLSLVVLMCESSEIEIRVLGLRAACLICPTSEHKYGQLENIMFNFLKDPVDRIVKDTVGVFVPVLARSALMAGKFSSSLYSRIISSLVKSSTEGEWKTVLLYLEVLKVLVLAKLAYVINVQIVKEMTHNCDMEINLQDVLLCEQESFIDLQCYMSDSYDAKNLIVAMNSLLKEKPDVRWAELTWFVKVIRQILEIATTSKILNHSAIYELLITLFSSYVYNFGVHFTTEVMNPIFLNIINDLENKLEKLHAVNVDSVIIVGIYLVTIVFSVEESEQQSEFLQKWVMYSSIRSLPSKIISIPLKWLAKHRPDALDFYLQCLREFSASSCDSTSGSTIRVYIANLITELLNIAQVSDECIERHLLPAVTALLYDDDVSVREAAISAWGSVTRTCVVRAQSTSLQTVCWPPFEELLKSRPLTGKEGAKAAEALTLLVLPTVESHAVSEKAVSLLCLLCHRQLSSELVAALTPGLQLATHHCSHHPALLPALRKLEESVQSPSLTQYKPAIEALLHVITNETPRVPSPKPATNLQAAQEVGRRVTQMFQHSKTNMNLQNIFKKKT
ncbi:RAB11-binding protein RELCH-like [Colias croceus]|uniref:RAB11-binding protein RELCH-like n=1 Tax=Colias crocea TaxID=72248 RepID=UPI001E2809D9|nr:RAB11-binding protein RELCH-like [Colias croceus]